MKMKLLRTLMAAMLTVTTLFGMAQNQPNAAQMQKRIEFVLCPDQKPVGKPASAAEANVRIVEVGDFSDAYAMLLRICKAKELKEEKKAGNMYYTYTMPDGKGQLVLTDKVKADTKEIAVLMVKVEGVISKVKEVRFVK